MGDRLYRLLLRAFPRAARDRDGGDMLRQFAAERAAARGPWATAVVWLRGAGDALWHGLLARLGVAWSVRAARGDRRAPAGVAGRPRPIRPFGVLGAGLVRDVRLAARRLAAAPGFTAVALLTLALGIGANTAIASAVHGVLLRPLPLPASDRLVSLHHVWEGARTTLSPPNFLDMQARTRALDSAAAWDTNGVVLTGAGDPAPLVAAEVSAGFFETLRAAPLLGRTFVAAEHEPGRARVVVMGHALWRQRFSGDAALPGRAIQLDGASYEVIGVMPQGFAWPLDADLWLPVEYDESYRSTNRGAWYLDAVGRLRPDATLDDARAELGAIARQLEQEHPEANAKVGLTAHPLLDTLVGDASRGLFVLLAAVGLVLLIACANVANLLLARATGRREETAVRLALGARRSDLVRQTMVEGLVLAAAGGAAGLALAAWAVPALAALPVDVPRLAAIELDGAVVAIAAATTMATGVLFSLAPALHVGGAALAGSLGARGRTGAGGRSGHRTRNALVVVETALAVVLLVGAGLLGRSFARLSHVDPGFDARSALTFQVSLPSARYPDDARRIAFYDALRERALAVPGVTAVTAVLAVPPAGQLVNLSFDVEGRPPDPSGTDPTLEVSIAGAGYFEVMGIPIVRGRAFDDTDRAGTPPVLVLTESAVRLHFPGEDPIGQRIQLGWRRDGGFVGGEVIGVAADVRSFALDEAPPAQVYVALAQAPIGGMTFVARTGVDPMSVLPAVRRVVRELDPELPLTRAGTLDAHVRDSIASERLLMGLLAAFAAVALSLAGIGVFGVLSYLVSQRAREIGVRMALGASPSSVVSLVVRRAVALSGLGAAIGLAGAALLSRTLETLLYDVRATDPATFVTVGVGLMGVAIAAAWLPARRAAQVDPLTALRSE